MNLKNNKKYVDFTTLKNNMQITKQWNALYKSSKTGMNQKDVTVEELRYIINTTTNTKVYTEALEQYNKSAKRSNRISGTTYEVYDIYAFSKRNVKKSIEENKMKFRKDKVEKLLDEIGYGKGMGRELYQTISGEIIPNYKMVGVPFEKIKKDIESMGKRKRVSKAELEEAIAKKKEEYDIFMKAVKGINKGRASEITDTINERVNKFLFDSVANGDRRNGYFGNLPAGSEIEKQKLEALIGKLNVGEKLAVENLMVSNEFLQVWSSDNKSSSWNPRFRQRRLSEIIKIIEEHLGQGVEVDKVTGEIRFYELSTPPATTTGLKLKDYIGR